MRSAEHENSRYGLKNSYARTVISVSRARAENSIDSQQLGALAWALSVMQGKKKRARRRTP